MIDGIWTQGNAGRMAINSVCDGYRLLFRDIGADEFQRRLERLDEIVLGNTAMDLSQKSRHIKAKVLRSSGEKGGSIYAVQVTGPAAASFGHLPWSWAWSLSQVHFKTFADEVYTGATTGFADAMYASEGTGQLSFFSAKKENNRPKDGGSKGVRVGSRKSDVHTIVYKRQRQRAGIETRVQDKALNRMVNETELAATLPDSELTDAQKMGSLHRRAAHHGYRQFLREVRRRGVNIANYFSAVTTQPEGAIIVNGFNYLDHNEEVAATSA